MRKTRTVAIPGGHTAQVPAGGRTLRERLREWATGPGSFGNPDGTVFIGRPEIEDLARALWTSKAAVSHVVNRIAGEHRLARTRACDGETGYEIRKEWF